MDRHVDVTGRASRKRIALVDVQEHRDTANDPILDTC
jgi:hypothetical protein